MKKIQRCFYRAIFGGMEYQMGNKKIRIKGKMSQYLRVPAYFSLFWLLATGIAFAIDAKAGYAMSLATVIYIIVVIGIYFGFRKNIVSRLVDFGAEYSQVQRQMFHELEIPYGLIDETGKILWTNAQMDMMFDGKNIRNKVVLSLFEEFKPEYLMFEDGDRNEFTINFSDKVYRVVLKMFSLKDRDEESELAVLQENGGSIISMYMFDETLIRQLTKETKEEKLVTGHIYIDNYDEVIQSVESTRRTLLFALIDRKVNIYFSQYDGIVRKLENDKYFVIFKAKYLSKMQTNKFAILDEVKTVNIGNSMSVTVSIGIGTGGNGLLEDYELARSAIDMALGRGGDQAVLKEGNKVYYYGGKSKSVEKNTKVKSRVKATAFRELIDSKEKIFVMGHHIGDNDSFGAAIGIYRIGKTIGKKVQIVLGEVSSSVVPLVEKFKESDTYEEDLFITGQEAQNLMTKNDALIIVDCNRAEYTEYPELVRRAQCIVVFDHHRQTTDVIDNAQLSYIELSASSASEMVVEVMQYIKEPVKLLKMEAEALYGGIMVDTSNFTNRTGVRTFEAAAYLKKHGADIAGVRRMFRDDMNDYKARATAIQNAEIFLEEYALSICVANNVSSPTVVGAQAANELLNVKGVKASFVCTPYNDQVYISARSVDKVNVQLIMEQFGGGGHMNLAGAQVKDKQAGEVIFMLKQMIRQMLQEGEL